MGFTSEGSQLYVGTKLALTQQYMSSTLLRCVTPTNEAGSVAVEIVDKIWGRSNSHRFFVYLMVPIVDQVSHFLSQYGRFVANLQGSNFVDSEWFTCRLKTAGQAGAGNVFFSAAHAVVNSSYAVCEFVGMYQPGLLQIFVSNNGVDFSKELIWNLAAIRNWTLTTRVAHGPLSGGTLLEISGFHMVLDRSTSMDSPLDSTRFQ